MQEHHVRALHDVVSESGGGRWRWFWRPELRHSWWDLHINGRWYRFGRLTNVAHGLTHLVDATERGPRHGRVGLCGQRGLSLMGKATRSACPDCLAELGLDQGRSLEGGGG
jgi:hypothetical protein